MAERNGAFLAGVEGDLHIALRRLLRHLVAFQPLEIRQKHAGLTVHLDDLRGREGGSFDLHCGLKPGHPEDLLGERLPQPFEPRLSELARSRLLVEFLLQSQVVLPPRALRIVDESVAGAAGLLPARIRYAQKLVYGVGRPIRSGIVVRAGFAGYDPGSLAAQAGEPTS